MITATESPRGSSPVQVNKKSPIRRITLRGLLRALALTAIAIGLCIAYATLIEPHWLCVKRVQLSPTPSVRLIHISDIHFEGDRHYLERVVQKINSIDADFVCFTGDMIEEAAFAKGALEILSKLNKPLYGVEGNHDQWALRSFDEFTTTFRQTGGRWLRNEPILLPAKHVALIPIIAGKAQTPAGYKRILLQHYPVILDALRGEQFDLLLAGHTHGSQIRIPYLSRSCLDLGPYDKGLFQTPCGPLYVNPGIGTFLIKARFLCRPEITVIEL